MKTTIDETYAVVCSHNWMWHFVSNDDPKHTLCGDTVQHPGLPMNRPTGEIHLGDTGSSCESCKQKLINDPIKYKAQLGYIHQGEECTFHPLNDQFVHKLKCIEIEDQMERNNTYINSDYADKDDIENVKEENERLHNQWISMNKPI